MTRSFFYSVVSWKLLIFVFGFWRASTFPPHAITVKFNSLSDWHCKNFKKINRKSGSGSRPQRSLCHSWKRKNFLSRALRSRKFRARLVGKSIRNTKRKSLVLRRHEKTADITRCHHWFHWRNDNWWTNAEIEYRWVSLPGVVLLFGRVARGACFNHLGSDHDTSSVEIPALAPHTKREMSTVFSGQFWDWNSVYFCKY